MPKDNTVAGLYLRLRLNYDELNQDFIRVEETVKSNVQRLGRESALINLKAAIDLTGVTDAEQRLKIEQQKLTQLIELQTQKVRLYEAAWKDAGESTGYASKRAQEAEIKLKQQELALANLSQRLKEIAEQQKQMSQVKTDKANFDNSLLGKYTNIKGDIAGKIGNLTSAFSGLKDATSSADAAISKTLEIIGAIPSPVGKAVAALASIPLVARGIENSLLDMAKPAIEAGDAMYVMSRGMQLSIADTAKLSTVCKVTGIEINEVNGAMRRLSAQLNKNSDEDNARMKMLERFGAVVKDSNGNIKNEVQLIEELSKALKKAEDAGQGAAFRDIVGGRFWSGDFVTFLEDYAGNVELAGQIVKNGLANPVLAHEVQGNINAMNTQAGQLGNAFSSALMPVANDIVPRITKEMGELTKVIAENADGIKTAGQILADVVSGIGTLASKATIEVTKLVGAVGQAVKGLKELKSERPVDNDIVQLYLDDKEIESFNDLVQKELERKFKPAELDILQASPSFAQIESTLRERLKPTYDEIIRLRQEAEETTKKIQEMNNALKETGMTTADANRPNLSPDLLEAAKKESQFFNKISDEIYKLNHDEYENKKYDLLKWQQELINSEETTAEKRAAIESLFAAKSEQIEKQHAEKLAEIQESIAASRRTDLENALDAIDKEKDAWISAGMEEVEASKLATQEKIETIQKLEEEWAEHIHSIYQTALEQRLEQIEKERQAWIQKGIDEVKATKAAEEEKAQAQKNAAMSVLKSQLKEYRAFEQGGYEGLRDYQLKLLYKSGIKPQELNITPEQIANFQKAQQIASNSLLPNFMTDTDKYNHNLLRGSQYDQERGFEYRIPADDFKVDLSEALQNIKTGFEDFDNDIGNVSANFDELPTSLNDVTENLLGFSEKLQDVTESISEIKIPEKQPVNVNVTVQINEAHAWDYEHMRELADKVADELEPAIVSAIGGDSNSY